MSNEENLPSYDGVGLMSAPALEPPSYEHIQLTDYIKTRIWIQTCESDTKVYNRLSLNISTSSDSSFSSVVTPAHFDRDPPTISSLPLTIANGVESLQPHDTQAYISQVPEVLRRKYFLTLKSLNVAIASNILSHAPIRSQVRHPDGIDARSYSSLAAMFTHSRKQFIRCQAITKITSVRENIMTMISNIAFRILDDTGSSTVARGELCITSTIDWSA